MIGTGILITEEDKWNIYQFLQENEIPFSKKIYLSVYKRYVKLLSQHTEKEKIFQKIGK